MAVKSSYFSDMLAADETPKVGKPEKGAMPYQTPNY